MARSPLSNQLDTYVVHRRHPASLLHTLHQGGLDSKPFGTPLCIVTSKLFYSGVNSQDPNSRGDILRSSPTKFRSHYRFLFFTAHSISQALVGKCGDNGMLKKTRIEIFSPYSRHHRCMYAICMYKAAHLCAMHRQSIKAL